MLGTIPSKSKLNIYCGKAVSLLNIIRYNYFVMLRRVGPLSLAFVLVFSLLTVLPRVSAASTCTTPVSISIGNICVAESQTAGAAGEEDQDYVVITNPTALTFAPTNVRLQYVNSQGILDSSLGPGSFAPGETKTFVSSSLKSVNPDALNLTLPLASSGGSLRLVRLASSTSETILTTYDQVGWGSSMVGEGSPLAVQTSAARYVRQTINNQLQDTDNNTADFIITLYDCPGASIDEIQPFVTDSSGQAVDAWIELLGNVPPVGDCRLITGAGDVYKIPAADMPNQGELSLIDHANDGQGQSIPLYIGDSSGQVWIAAASYYGGQNSVRVPLATASYTNVSKGQSWAMVDGLWRRTYVLTPGEPNVYQAAATVFDDDPNACETVRISELLPNPVGDDSGSEWIELHNGATGPAPLGKCIVDVAGTGYSFLPDDSLAPGEWRSFTSLYTSEGDDKAVNLKNSGDTQVSLLRMRPDTNETVQSFIYSDAPEAQSWARFDAGWQWTYSLTPDAPNVLQSEPPVPAATEFAANTQSPDSVGGSSSDPTVENTGLPIAITEMLPNPASPQTDENDEFIELYNPTPEPVDLDGYKVQTGTNYTYSYTLDKLSIPATGYLALTSGSTGLTLSNTAGRARLLDPSGAVIYVTDAYEDAAEGAAWALIDGKWQWTGTSTPGGANVYTALALKTAKSTTKTTAAKATKAATAKKPAASAVKAAKTTKPKTTTSTSGSANDGQEAKAPVHGAVIAGVGGLAVLYGAYEYRNDAANWFEKLRRNRAARRANRQ
jgi:hypothetical protein